MRYADEDIARVCHEANRALQTIQQVMKISGEPLGVPVAPTWAQFPRDEQLSVIAGVRAAIGGATPEQLHESWRQDKLASGWRYGLLKDTDAKTHPNLVAYWQLSREQRRKDALFAAIVKALTSDPPRDRDDGAGFTLDAPLTLTPGATLAEAMADAGKAGREMAARIDSAGLLLYGVSQMVRKSWDSISGWLGMGQQDAVDAVEHLAALQARDAVRAEPLPLGELAGDYLAPSARVMALPSLEQAMARPRVGSQVHYVSEGSPVRADGTQKYPSCCRAAQITALEPLEWGKVSLHVVNPTGEFYCAAVPYDAGSAQLFDPAAGFPLPPAMCYGLGYAGGSWHWPQS